MGYWRTLHLFDDQKFYGEVIPVLRGERGDVLAEYHDYLTARAMGGIDRIPPARVKEMVAAGAEFVADYFRPLTADFKQHPNYQRHEDLEDYLLSHTHHYEICSFFEHYVFKTCTDFFPHAAVGKYGVHRKFDATDKSLAASIIDELDRINVLFNHGSAGIVNWLTHEEVALLFMDRANLSVAANQRGEQVLHLLEVSHQHGFGLVQGVDMREGALDRLPQYKLLSKEQWEDFGEDKLRSTLNG